jgi:hypothetical protein
MEQPPNAVYSSRKVKTYRFCPIRIGVKFEYKGPTHV